MKTTPKKLEERERIVMRKAVVSGDSTGTKTVKNLQENLLVVVNQHSLFIAFPNSGCSEHITQEWHAFCTRSNVLAFDVMVITFPIKKSERRQENLVYAVC